MKYEEIRPVLQAAAMKNKVNLSFAVALTKGGLQVVLKN